VLQNAKSAAARLAGGGACLLRRSKHKPNVSVYAFAQYHLPLLGRGRGVPSSGVKDGCSSVEY